MEQEHREAIAEHAGCGHNMRDLEARLRDSEEEERAARKRVL
jgi:hypothetical protein